MNQSTHKIAATLGCFCLTALVSTQALAQQGEGLALEEVIVTAQKRAESLQDVPVSITALTATDIENQKIREGAEIAALVPNLFATKVAGDGFPIFSLRGVSMSDYSYNQSSPVATYVDEVYKGNPAIQGVQIFDLERIEVLRGPQGTLYGKNTTGGAVNFITARPGYDTEGYFSVGVGNYARLETQGAFQTALAEDTLAMRIAYTWVDADGWLENGQPGVRDASAIGEYGVRLGLLWEPSDTLDVLLRVYTGEVDAVNYGIVPFNISADGVGAGLYGLYNLLGATDQTDYYRDSGQGWWDFDSEQDANRKISNDAVALTVNWDFSDDLTLTSITSWDDGDILNPEDADGSPNQVLTPWYYAEAEQFAQDLRVTSDNDGAFNFIAGVYYAEEKVYNETNIGFWTDLDLNADGVLDYNDCLDPLYTSLGFGQATESGAQVEQILNEFGLSLGAFAPAGCNAQNDFNQDRTSWAGYFDGRWDLSDQWTLRMGLRYTDDETSLKNFSARLLGNDGVPLLNTIPGDAVDPYAVVAPESFSDSEWTGKLGADFVTEGGTLVYGSFSHGYRSGAYNAQAFFDPAELTRVAPEKLDAWEVGFKSEPGNGRFQFNGAAFWYDYSDQQFLNVDPATLAQTLINIDKSEIYGLELELAALPTPDLRLTAGLGLLHSEVKDGTLSGVNLAGNELPLAPEMTANLALDWDAFELGSGLVTLYLDASYVDGHYFEVFNIERIKQGSYWLSNARIAWTSADDRWQTGLWVKNLADEEYRTSTIDLLSSFGFDYSHVGPPRTFGADLTYRF